MVSKCAKDERFKGIDKMKERESIFDEHMVTLKKKEKQERTIKSQSVSLNSALLPIKLWVVLVQGCVAFI